MYPPASQGTLERHETHPRRTVRHPACVKEVPGLEPTDPTVPELVSAAVEGDQSAWDALVVRYTPLVLGIAMRFRLSRDDVADVSQTVWLLLVQHLPKLRTPEALPGWIATTT